MTDKTPDRDVLVVGFGPTGLLEVDVRVLEPGEWFDLNDA